MADHYEFFDGEPRPHWAGPISINSEQFVQSLASTGERETKRRRLGRGAANVEMKGDRPTQVSGVVLTCGTRGRDRKIAVPELDLKYTRNDVGHLFALSSGGAEDSTQYVPQSRWINRAPLNPTRSVPSSKLEWRALELYAQYHCQRGFDPDTRGRNYPEFDEIVHVSQTGDRGSGFQFWVNDVQLLFVPTSVYSHGEERDFVPNYCIKWVVTCNYPIHGGILPRGNDPSSFEIELSYATSADPANWHIFCRNTMKNDQPLWRAAETAEDLDDSLHLTFQNIRAKKEYAKDHPRRSNRF